ncbi:MAG: DeoR/GlpR family DNA-binding transcription regulator [Devosia sp.]
MLTEERHDVIRTRLAAEGKVLASVLATTFGVSEDTVRRDLRELARAGECRRVYGGALAMAPDLGSIAQRQDVLAESKRRLAQTAVSLIGAGQTIFIDAGSTNLAVAAALSRELPLTVITNAPAVALALADHRLCRTVVIGGTFDADKGACVGAQAVGAVRQFNADAVVLGTCGIDALVGVSALDGEEAAIKRAMVEQSRRVIVAATNDKLGTVAPYVVAGPERVDELVVEGEAGGFAGYTRAGMRVHVV